MKDNMNKMVGAGTTHQSHFRTTLSSIPGSTSLILSINWKELILECIMEERRAFSSCKDLEVANASDMMLDDLWKKCNPQEIL